MRDPDADRDRHDDCTWRDSCTGEYWYSVAHALIIQRARDAAEERAAWVQFMAAAIAARYRYPRSEAEEALDEYRRRFTDELVRFWAAWRPACGSA